MSINSGPRDPHTSSVAHTALTSTKDFVIFSQTAAGHD